VPSTLSTVNAITKEIYQGTIQDQLQNETVGLKRIERTSEGVESQVGGKYVTFPIRTRRNQGIGSRNELEALPTAGQQGWASVRVGLKYAYGRVQLSGQVIELVNDNYQAFASAMDLEMTGLKNDLSKDQNRQFYGTNTGTIATLTGANTGNNSFQVAPLTGGQYIEVGQQIDIVTSSSNSTVIASNRQVLSINRTTGVGTFDGAVATTAIGNVIVRTGNYNREITGLGAIVTNTGVLFNVDPTVEPTWQAVVNGNGGTTRPLSEGLMITLTDQVRINGGKTSLILTSLGVRRAYFNLLSQQRRFPSTTTFEGGFQGLAFSNGREIPVIEDVDCPSNTMYFLDESKLKIYRAHDWSWMERDNSIWHWVVGFDAYEAVMNQYWEMGTNQRNAHAVLTDITEG
jgi:hypothetical protein